MGDRAGRGVNHAVQILLQTCLLGCVMAPRARKRRVDVPRSKLKLKIAEILKQEGYIADFREINGKLGGQGIIEVMLRYDERNEAIISDMQRVSKPGLRKYLPYDDIPKVRNGLGIMIMTTSKGVMTDREARRSKIGGEALCAVW